MTYYIYTHTYIHLYTYVKLFYFFFIKKSLKCMLGALKFKAVKNY